MAQVASATHQRVDRLLSHAHRVWQCLPQVVDEIDSWDVMDRVRFVEEWPLEEQRWEAIQRLAADDALDAG